MNDLERLGRPGAYRLGALRWSGGEVTPPARRPSFARRRRHRLLAGIAGSWLLAARPARRSRETATDIGPVDRDGAAKEAVRLLSDTRPVAGGRPLPRTR